MSRATSVRERLSLWVGHVAQHYPARLAMGAFGAVILVVTGLLMLPFSTASGKSASFVDALFTATSAVCVTGLTVVDTGTYWSDFGRAVILLGIKVGGLGVMTLASVLALAVSRRLGVTQRMLAAGEARASGLGDVKRMLIIIVVFSSAVELIITAILFPRFWIDGLPPLSALWHAVFYAVSAFNNAGFVPNAGGLVEFTGDFWVIVPIGIGVLVGALGFPVYVNLMESWNKPRNWSLHTKLTLWMVVVLTGISTVFLGVFEWNNPATYGGESVPTRLLHIFFGGINQRSGGFAAISHENMTQQTWLLEDVMMFIGGGSGGTAGGIRITTLAVLLLAIVAEARGRRDMEAFGKRIGTQVLRTAVAITLVSLAFVLLGSTAVLFQTAHLGWRLDEVLYEVVSAYATCGLSVLSAEQTAAMPDSTKYTLTLLMFIGRVGTTTIAAALALNSQRRVIRYPSGRILIG